MDCGVARGAPFPCAPSPAGRHSKATRGFAPARTGTLCTRARAHRRRARPGTFATRRHSRTAGTARRACHSWVVGTGIRVSEAGLVAWRRWNKRARTRRGCRSSNCRTAPCARQSPPQNHPPPRWRCHRQHRRWVRTGANRGHLRCRLTASCAYWPPARSAGTRCGQSAATGRGWTARCCWGRCGTTRIAGDNGASRQGGQCNGGGACTDVEAVLDKVAELRSGRNLTRLGPRKLPDAAVHLRIRVRATARSRR